MLVRQSVEFARWLKSLRDQRARIRINARIERLSSGLLGDSKSLGGGVYELRLDYGPGYRVYYANRTGHILLLLIGGNKAHQSDDIKRARELLEDWRDD